MMANRFFNVAFIILVATTLSLGWIVYEQANNPQDLFVDHGATGPHAWVSTDNGIVQSGPLVSKVTAGDSFGIVSTLCPERVATYTAIVDLVREEDGEIVLSRRRLYEPNTRRCGSAGATFQTDVAWPPGAYTLHRRLMITAPGRNQRNASLGSLTFEVVPPHPTD